MAGKKKILFISHLCGLNGSERSLYGLIKGINRSSEFEVSLLVPQPGPLACKIQDLNIPVMIAPYYFWIGSQKKPVLYGMIRLFLNLLSMPRLYRKIKKLRPDLVYTNSLATPVGAIIAWALGIPHIWHIREFVKEGLVGRYDFGESLTLSLVDRLSDAIVCNSKALKTKLLSLHLFKTPIDVIYNGFDFSKAGQPSTKIKKEGQRAPHRPADLLLVGSIKPEKGQEDAIHAVAGLRRKGHHLRLSIAGTGHEKYIRQLKAIAHQENVSDTIRFLGYVEKVHKLYLEADITLICSGKEAFGRVAVESLANGTPVIGTNQGGLPEIIVHEKTGLLYSPGDIGRLTFLIEQLLTDTALYQSLSQNALPYVSARFNSDLCIQSTMALLAETLRHRQRRE